MTLFSLQANLFHNPDDEISMDFTIPNDTCLKPWAWRGAWTPPPSHHQPCPPSPTDSGMLSLGFPRAGGLMSTLIPMFWEEVSHRTRMLTDGPAGPGALGEGNKAQPMRWSVSHTPIATQPLMLSTLLLSISAAKHARAEARP